MPYSVILKISVMIKTGSGFQIELHFIATDEQFWSHLHFRMNRCSEDDTNFLLKWNIAMVWSCLKNQENYILIYLSFPHFFFFPFSHQSFTLENWFLPPTPFFPSFFLSFFIPWRLIHMSCIFWNVIWAFLLMATLRKRISVNNDQHSLIANSNAS